MKPLTVVVNPVFSLNELGELHDLTEIIAVKSIDEIEYPEKVRIIICEGEEKIDRAFIAQAKNLKIIAVHALGYENIDVKAAAEKGIFVVNARSAAEEETVADYTLGLLISIARKINEADSYVKSGKWKSKTERMVTADIYGKTLGIIRLGHIGGLVAERASAFKMKILYYDLIRRDDLEKKIGAVYTALEKLLIESDYVTIHTPLTKETYHLIGEKELKLMKSTAYLINTSRGKVIDEKALIKALENKQIAGAALDTFSIEPLPEDNPLRKMKNTILSPHIAAATKECEKRIISCLVNNIIKCLNEERPTEEDIVN